MTISANVYLTLPGNTREVMGFYGRVFGAEPTFMPVSAMPGMEDSDAIMHSELRAPALTLMASDNIMAPDQPVVVGDTYTIALMAAPADGEEIRRIFGELADGGQIVVPLEKQPWGDEYGQCRDRYGISWAVNVGNTQA